MMLVAASAALLLVHLVAAAVWIGGYVAIAVVARVAQHTLDPPTRITFFRALGRAYGLVGGASLVIALATGALLLGPSISTRADRAAVGTAAALLVATAAGVRQARAIGRLRSRALDDPLLAPTVERAALAAGVLRGAIGLLTLALVVLAAIIAG